MMLREQVFAQAVLLAGQMDEQQTRLLQVLSRASCSCLAARLREGITPRGLQGGFCGGCQLVRFGSAE